MKITILCSSTDHPINAWLLRWMEAHRQCHEIGLVRCVEELEGGDLLFLISCTQIVTADDRNKFSETLVIHASDLPRGRGWSPHIWDIVQGGEKVTVTLLEAEDKVDTGAIWGQVHLNIPKHHLADEINASLFDAELSLMDVALRLYGSNPGVPQSEDEPTYLPKRTPKDSQLDVNRTIAEQFDLMRVCDAERFPAFFEIYGHRYKITLEKI